MAIDLSRTLQTVQRLQGELREAEDRCSVLEVENEQLTKLNEGCISEAAWEEHEYQKRIAALEAKCERLRGDVENTARDWDSLRMTIQGAYGLLSREVNWGTRSLSVKRAYAMLLDALPTVEICGDKTDESEADDASS